MGTVTHKSFTLIELVVAVGVIGIILPTVFNIFFIMIRQQLVLVSYQEMKQQGDSAQRNIKNIIQDRATSVTDSDYTAIDFCPLLPAPTPTYAPNMYILDRDGKKIKLSLTGFGIASIAATVSKTYNLTSSNVTIANSPDVGFSCYRINEFTPATISTKFTVIKSTAFKEVSLPYSFNTRLRNY